MTHHVLGRIWNVACVLGAFAWLGASSSAHAQEQFRAPTWDRPSASVGLRFGSDDLNLGFGLHGGYTIDPGIYVGGLFDYFLGESEDVPGGEVSFSAWMLMIEGGYDFGVTEDLVLRPILGLGMVGVTGEVCGSVLGTGGCTDRSDTDVELGLGGHVLYLIDNITLGGELRLLLGGVDAFMIGANVGMIF